jgi:hypothetical protein
LLATRSAFLSVINFGINNFFLLLPYMRTALCLEIFLLQLVVSSSFFPSLYWLVMLVIGTEDGCTPPASRWAPRIGVVDIRRFRHVDLHGSCWGFRDALRKISCVRVFVDSGRAKHRVRRCGHVREVDCGIQPSCGLVSHSECFGVDNEQAVGQCIYAGPAQEGKEKPQRDCWRLSFAGQVKCVVKQAGREGAILNRASVHCLRF